VICDVGAKRAADLAPPTRAIEHADPASPVTNQPGVLEFPVASVTPSRRTPCLLAINYCVVDNSFDAKRSKLSNSHRHNCYLDHW
jgi:hypothetical protein